MTGYVRHVKELPYRLRPRLPSLDIELTERCDNECIHCCINLPAADSGAQAREMTTDQVKDVLRQAVDLGCLQVRFTGGEPLLRPDFADIYVHARRLGLKVVVFTNARRVTPHLAELWARMPPLEPIEVTVYGMRRESYETVSRVRGSFSEFRRGVDLLLERKVPFVVKGALLPPNRAEIDEFEAWATTIPAMEGAPSHSMFFDLRHRRDDPAKSQLIRSLRVSPEASLAVLTRDPARYRAEMAEFASRFMGPAGDRLFACGAGRTLCVDSYGRAQPCLTMRAPELTVDVLGSSLAGALESFSGLGRLRAINPEYLRRCAVCPLHGLCEQCPAKSWTEHGTLDTPVEYLCEVAHAQAWSLGWLRSGENAWESRHLQDTVG